ncbi:MAG: LssY C-terminal domain-containing protein [Rhizobiaceae bacterium]|nr:LssY C-terminal domain-containing protein [Rhizobiaceae bacterium]
MREQSPARKRRRLRGIAYLVAVYAAAAYIVIPELWRVAERFLLAQPGGMVTHTTAGIPGDPINIGIGGDKAQLITAFAKAGWDAADQLTLKTAVEIGLAVLFDRPYPDAPVSTLLFEGRPQDLAFEKPIGNSPDRRNHVRFWLTAQQVDGKELWLGSASLDTGAGVSHDTGQITHHIGPDIDAERNLVVQQLEAAGLVQRVFEIPGRGATQNGRNGGGDRYFTDGVAKIVVLKDI